MNYNVISFYKGEVRNRDRVEASSPIQAAKLSGMNAEYSHVIVYGKKMFRYVGKKLKAEKSIPNIYKAYWKSKRPSVLLMYGTTPEFYKFRTEKERNEKYEEMKKCITSMSVEYAKAEAELTGIIASLDEIKDSKKSSTSKKTLSGFVTNATCKDTPTQPNTGRPSGTDNAEDTDTSTWSDGSRVSRSERSRTLLVTVKLSDNQNTFEYPGINSSMHDLDGKSMKVKYASKYRGNKICKAHENPWLWNVKWLDKKTAYGKAIGYDSEVGDGLRPSEMGKIFKFTKCGCGCGMYYNGNGKYAKLDWIETGYSKQDYDKQQKRLGAKIASLPQSSLSSKMIQDVIDTYKKSLQDDK